MHQGDFVQPDGSAVVSFVNISTLRVQDGGEYACKATNDVGVIEHTARIGEYNTDLLNVMLFEAFGKTLWSSLIEI